MRKQEVEAELCRRSYYYFLQKFIHLLIKEDIVWNWHIKFICDKMEEYGRCIIDRRPPPKSYLIINIPPGSTKSTICTQFFPIWLWINDQSIITIALSYSAQLSLRHATRSRDILRSNEFKELFPEIEPKEDQDAITNYANKQGGQRISSSIGGTVLGDHGHVQIIDDPLNVEEAVSEAERTSANDFIRHTLPTRKKDKKNTPTILIMQRLHEEDPSGMLLEIMKNQVEHISLPAEQSAGVIPVELESNYINGLLDPIRLDKDILDSQELILGSVGYSQQYNQLAVPQEGALFKQPWFAKKITLVDFITNVKNKRAKINYYIDTAYTEKQKNDPSLILATTFFEGKLYLINRVKGRWEFPDFMKEIPLFVEKIGHSGDTRIVIEPKASGHSVAQQLKTDSTYNVFLGEPPKDDKVTRATGITPFCESMRLVLVEGDWNDNFVNQCKMFPNAKHDEEIDCLVMAVNDAIKSGKRKPPMIWN